MDCTVSGKRASYTAHRLLWSEPDTQLLNFLFLPWSKRSSRVQNLSAVFGRLASVATVLQRPFFFFCRLRLENREYGRRDPSRWPRGTLYPQKSPLTSPTSGGRSVGIVRSRTQATEFVCLFVCFTLRWDHPINNQTLLSCVLNAEILVCHSARCNNPENHNPEYN
jgi:hypothetical protein